MSLWQDKELLSGVFAEYTVPEIGIYPGSLC